MAGRTITTVLDARIDGLVRALRQASRAVSDTAGELEKLEGGAKRIDSLDPEISVSADTRAAQAGLDGVEGAVDSLSGREASVGVTADAAAAENALAGAESTVRALDGAEATIDVLADAGQAEKALDGARADVRALDGAEAEVHITVDSDDVTAALDAVPGEAGKAGIDAGTAILDGLNSTPIAGAVAGIVVAYAGAVGGLIAKGVGIDAGRDLFSARTGLDEATAAKFGRAAGEAYSQAWGDSIEANMETARTALANGLISPADTEAAVSAVIAQLSGVTDILGADIPEAAEAAGNMIKSGLAANAEQAFNTIVKGYQAGADRSGDFLDTLREYSSMFQSLGLDGPAAIGLVTQAMEAGARSSDLAADGLKEFSIRAQDMSATSVAAFKAVGLDAEDMASRIAKGGPAAREALGMTLDALRAIEDPIARNAAGVALFGTQWEDMGNGAAVLAMNLGTLGSEWGNLAGTASSALKTMSDNTASQMEAARRNVEVAVAGIAGALAAAFSDEIGGVATWVSSNREAILRFGVDTVNALMEAGRAAVEFGAWAVESFGAGADAVAPFVNAVGLAVEGLGRLTADDDLVRFGEGIQQGAEGMAEFGETSQAAADVMRNAMIGALDETQARMNSWAGPELISAAIHDAVVQSQSYLGVLSATIDATGGTVTINGEAMNAEQALEAVVGEINDSDGTVTINGQSVPAGQALATLIAQINAGAGTVTINGNNASARSSADEAARYANGKTATMTITASGSAALAEAERIRARIASNPAYIPVRASSQIARSGGGWVPGRAAGGWVDAPYPGPGRDNVLWPLSYGGQTLSQPLAGREFVVNAVSSQQWAPFLEAINGGLRPPSSVPSSGGDLAVYVQNPWTGEYMRAHVRTEARRVVHETVSTARGL